MDITWIDNDGTERECHLPSPDSRYVVAPGHCPVCWSKAVIIAHDIKETAIFAEANRAKAEAHLRDVGSVEWFEVPPTYDLHLRGENPDQYDSDFYDEADAVCDRCRSRLGRLRVRVNTIFGRREDRLILSGQFGRVI